MQYSSIWNYFHCSSDSIEYYISVSNTSALQMKIMYVEMLSQYQLLAFAAFIQRHGYVWLAPTHPLGILQNILAVYASSTEKRYEPVHVFIRLWRHESRQKRCQDVNLTPLQVTLHFPARWTKLFSYGQFCGEPVQHLLHRKSNVFHVFKGPAEGWKYCRFGDWLQC